MLRDPIIGDPDLNSGLVQGDTKRLSQPSLYLPKKMKKIDQNNPCGFCQKRKSKVLYSTNDIYGNSYSLNQCDNCKAVFLDPRPTSEELLRIYDESYYGRGKEKFGSVIEKLINYFQDKRASLVNNYLSDKSKVLDIGCGNGRFLSFLKQKGDYELYGLELNTSSNKRVLKIPGINLRFGSLKPQDFKQESLSAITLFHVFEHLTEPKETLQTIRKILKKNGLLVMSFPNIDSVQSKFFKGKWFHLDPPKHLFFFKPIDFVRLMDGYGFELIKEKHFNLEYNPFGLNQSILNCLFQKREVLYEHLKGNSEYVTEYSKFNLFLQKLFFPLSVSIFIIFDFIDSLFKKGATVEFVFKKRS